MPAIDDVRFLQSQSDNSAKELRRFSEEGNGVGVNGMPDFDVTFNAGLTVNVAPGIAYVRGLSTLEQGMYRCYHGSSTPTVTLTAAHATLPRLDQIVLIVQDANEDGGANNRGFLDVVTGTATSGATLDNRNGAANLATQPSPTMIRLADVLVNANNSPALSNSNIRDRRPYGIQGVVPAITTNVDIVAFQPTLGLPFAAWKYDGADHANYQSAALMYLPRRIAATRIRWRYQQDGGTAVAASQSYRFVICDSSGRYLATSALTNFRGSAGNWLEDIITFTLNPELPSGYTFEACNYYVWFGVSNIASAGTFYTLSCIGDNNVLGRGPSTVNQYYAATSGGTTFPATNNILGMTDIGAGSGANVRMAVPVPALSIG